MNLIKNYIGLATTFHDSALAIVNSDGVVVFAEATERYMQNKRAMNICPDVFVRVSELIMKYCEPNDQLVIAHSWSDETQNLMRNQLEEMTKFKSSFVKTLGHIPNYINSFIELIDYCSNSQKNMCNQASITLEYEIKLNQKLENNCKEIITRKYNHHLTHAAAACFTSPFAEGVCAIVDGYGENLASNIFIYKDGKIKEIDKTRKDNTGSLGFFYTFVCEACGFGQLTGEEWKIMGLAAYGKLDKEIYELFKSVIRVDGLSIDWQMKNFANFFYQMESIKRKKDDPAIISANIAYTGQFIYSELLFEYLNNSYQYLHDSCDANLLNNLILGGGCALNSSANGQILDKTKFKNLHVFSAPGDDGNALGAALLAYHQDKPSSHLSKYIHTPYLGSEISKEKLNHLVKYSKINSLKVCTDEVYKKAAELLAEGKIIGWVQGRAEFGPRALGNRSILADPRSPNMKEIINSRIKFREEFRPFAPSILHEFGPEYFENYQESPYMERTLHFKSEVVKKVPAVVHNNGTGRLQTVKKELNEKYYQLIKAFYEITGIPLVLNTSFNIMGKPIIHSVEDAIAVFYTCGLDALFIEDILIEK